MHSKFLLLVLLISVTVFVYGCGGAKKNMSMEAEEGTQIRIYEVFGMDCPGCHSGMEKLADKIPGVIDSQANWKKQRLTVKVADETEVTDEAMFEAIRKANFTPGERIK